MTGRLFAFAAILPILAGCSTMSEPPPERLGHARLSFADGSPAGTVQLLAAGDRLYLGAAATKLSEGAHGFHLHMTGKCKGPDFKSAGAHLNPAGHDHGWLDEDGHHLGDMRNLEVGASGSIATTVAIRGSRDSSIREIFDADGTAVVIHADPDDYRTDPSGSAGARIACGVFEPA